MELQLEVVMVEVMEEEVVEEVMNMLVLGIQVHYGKAKVRNYCILHK